MTSLRLALLSLALAFTACGPADLELDGDEGLTLEVADELTANSRFETFKGKNGKFYFHLRAGNGEKVLQSQGYTTLASARGGIDSVKNNGLNEMRYLFREAVDGSRYFVLVAGNGRIIGVSEMYVSKSNAERGAQTVQNVLKAVVAVSPAVEGDARFETFKGLDEKFYFHLKAENGQLVLHSQSYASKAGATGGIDTVRSNGVNAARYQVREAADGQFYFVLKAGNGKVIGNSELYDSKAGAEAGIEATQAVLRSAK